MVELPLKIDEIEYPLEQAFKGAGNQELGLSRFFHRIVHGRQHVRCFAQFRRCFLLRGKKLKAMQAGCSVSLRQPVIIGRPAKVLKSNGVLVCAPDREVDLSSFESNPGTLSTQACIIKLKLRDLLLVSGGADWLIASKKFKDLAVQTLPCTPGSL